MPDDNEKITEQEPSVTDEEKAFAEDIEEEPGPEGAPEKKAEPEKKPDAGKKPEDGKKPAEAEPEKKSEKEPEKKPAEPETAKTRLDKRLESLKDPEPEKKKEPEPEKKAEPEKQPEKKPEAGEPEKPKPLTKEEVAQRLAIIDDSELPDEMIIGNDTVNLKSYAQEYPEDFATMKVVASVIAQRMVESALAKAGPKEKPADDKSEERLAALEIGIRQVSFDQAVATAVDDKGNLKHPDYYAITRGAGMKDFHAWVKSQPEKIQRLASSLDHEDGILILDYYKEATAKKKVAEHDEQAGKKKKEIDDIHSSTTRSDKSINDRVEDKGGKGSEQDEAEAAFLED